MVSRSSLRVDRKTSVLNALLPGSEIAKAGDVILNNMAKSKETIIFNVGGTVFETYTSTLYRLPHSPLADSNFLRTHFLESRGQYFFDRDPDVFAAILNYFRTGKLHLPSQCCGPAIKLELDYWGISENEIDDCCWANYNSWSSNWEALAKLEQDRKVHLFGPLRSWNYGTETHDGRCQQVKRTVWDILNSSRPGLASKIYGYVSLAMIVVSIFSFMAQTHEFFRIAVPGSSQCSDRRRNATAFDTSWTQDVLLHVSQNTSNITSTHSDSDLNLPSDLTYVLLDVQTTVSSNTASGDSDVKPNIGSNGSCGNSTGSPTNGVHESHPVLLYCDVICFLFFLSDFIVRFIVAPKEIHFCKLLISPMTIIEICALAPDLVDLSILVLQPVVGHVDLTINITFLRLLRTFRIFRLMRHFPGLWILFYTLKASLKELLLLLLFLCVGMMVFASLIYYTDDRETFTSIPMACWWAVITMTTVGYGDMYPTTNLGYMVGSITAICGVLVVGFTVPVLVNNFALYYQHTQSAISRESQRKKLFKKKGKSKERELFPEVTKAVPALNRAEVTNTVSESLANFLSNESEPRLSTNLTSLQPAERVVRKTMPHPSQRETNWEDNEEASKLLLNLDTSVADENVSKNEKDSCGRTHRSVEMGTKQCEQI